MGILLGRHQSMSFMSRSQQREHIFKLLFQIESIKPEDYEEHFQNYLDEQEKVSEENKESLKARTNEILPQLSEIDKQLNEKASGWKTTRMNKVDLAILRLAVYEMMFDDDVPVGVAINEGVELAKKYSGDDGPAFVNAVLAKFAQDAKP